MSEHVPTGWAPVPAELALDRRVSAGALRLWVLMDLHRPGHYFRPRQWAADQLGVSVATVKRWLAELESAGWAERVAPATPVRKVATWATVHSDDVEQGDPPHGSHMTHGRVTGDPRDGSHMTHGRVTGDPQKQTTEADHGKQTTRNGPASERSEASEEGGPRTYAAAGAATGKGGSDENGEVESEDEQHLPSGFAANQNRTVSGAPSGGEANPPCEDAERGGGSAARTQNESTGAVVEVVAIDRSGDDAPEPAPEPEPGRERTLDERYQAFPTEPVEVTDRQAGRMAKEAVAYYIDWRHQAGLGDPKVKTWIPQMGSSVKNLILDKGLPPRMALDALLEWHDVNIERASANQDPLRPGAIITIGARLAEAGGARHGVNGRGLSRAQQAEHARKNAVADLLTALQEQDGEVEQGAA